MSQGKLPVRNRLVPLSVCGGIALLTLLVYSPTFHYPFVNYDDPDYVSDNRNVQRGLTADSVRWAFTSLDAGNWHPLTWLSLQLDCQMYGTHPGGFHLTNVLLHTANALLLFLVLGRLTGDIWPSAAVAALFALHPLHVESVAWVAERKDVLSTLFWVLTLAAYGHYVRRPGVGRYLLVVLALAAGLLAKPMLVTLPCVLLLLDYWPLRRWQPGPRALLIEKAPLFALTLASCVITLRAQSRGEAVATLDAFPLATRIGNALLAYVSYLGKTFWPMHLAVYYPHPGRDLPVAQVLAAGLLLAVLTLLMLVLGRRRPYLAVGWLWYLGTLVPVIGLVQVGSQAMADRYTYVPLIGLFLLLCWGVKDLAAAWRLPSPYLAAIAAVVLAGCAALTRAQVRHWQSNLALWEHAAAVTDRNTLAHVNLGVCYLEEGRLSDARKELEKAVAIDPQVAEAHVNLGNVLAELGLWERAETEYRQAITLAPDRAIPRFNLGNTLHRMGRLEEALAEYRRGMALEPDNAWPHINLGNLLRDLGRLDEAEAAYRRAIALNPDDFQANTNLGIILADQDRLDEAIAQFGRASALEPYDAAAHIRLGTALEGASRLEVAQAEYRKALELGDQQAGGRLQACQRLRRLRQRLPDVLAGRDQPADNAERLAFADLCRQRGERRYALAASLYAEAFQADPGLADNLRAKNRLHAAEAAAAAGCGRGRDAERLDNREKARLRRQALRWLQDELTLLARQVQSGSPEARAAVQQALWDWRRDAALAGVRDPASLARRDRAERQSWEKLWADVEAMLPMAQ